MKFMESFEHPYIVKIYAMFREKYAHRQYDRRAFIWMERGDCDLDYVLKRTRGTGLSVDIVQMYMRHVVQALNYLYDRKIAHRDIKPANILMFNNERVAKLADFSVIKEIDHRKKTEESPCTPSFASPQLLLVVPNNPFKGDTWALGITILECLTGRRPKWFENQDRHKIQLKMNYRMILKPEVSILNEVCSTPC